MGRFLYEYDRPNVKYGPASDEQYQTYKENVANGIPFIEKGHHGYRLKMIVRESSEHGSSEEHVCKEY